MLGKKLCYGKVKRCYAKFGKMMGNVVNWIGKCKAMLFTYSVQSATLNLQKILGGKNNT